MGRNRKTAVIVGVLILIAYCVLGALVVESPVIKMFFEILSGTASIGVAILLFPIFKSYNKKLTIGYTFFKLLEGGTYVVIALLLFSQIITTGPYLLIHKYHVYIFGIAFLMLSLLLYQSKLVPKFISAWGIIGSAIMLVSVFLNMAVLSSNISMVISHLPVVLNEVFLAIWLIVKGFNAK